MTTIAELQVDVRTWLEDEHDYQFAKNRRTHQGDPSSSLHYITRVEIPNKWHRFRLYHGAWWPEGELKLQMQASQQLLKVAAAARGAFVWSKVVEGESVNVASDQSWQLLAAYEQGVVSGARRLPAREDLFAETVPIDLYLPARSEELGERFTYFGGLAVAHLAEAINCQGLYMMPRSGAPSGDL